MDDIANHISDKGITPPIQMCGMSRLEMWYTNSFNHLKVVSHQLLEQLDNMVIHV